ncbi:bacillithiol biosynthesis cysteine-adding enzyme BshC [Salisediminibacterium selenitireducens]|nr:bacillithiol biosynthesis cysteine-adding enzyme BshC [Salisediminibacterium selenitireducens]
MKIEQMNQAASAFLDEYREFSDPVRGFFDYSPDSKGEEARFEELDAITYNRQGLSDAMLHYQERFNPDEQAIKNIHKLKDRETTVVVGGQQAGVFGGPLYTVYKMMSVLLEAERLESTYGRSVVPVFWIAGEDHDEEEINHTYTFIDRQMKVKLKDPSPLKTPASETFVRKDDILRLLKDLVKADPESERTVFLLNKAECLLQDEETYSSFFVKWMSDLFRGTGLVFMDAQDPEIRRIEKDHFVSMIQKNNAVRQVFQSAVSTCKTYGYGEPIHTGPENAHLFLHDENGERQLLSAVSENQFTDPFSGRHWTETELIEALHKEDIRLSNNVVTRPVMQDLLLPVHTFIGGPGEIKYWMVLREVFHLFDHRMPVIKPRLQMTVVQRKTEKELKRYGMTEEEVLKTGVQKHLDAIIECRKTVDDEAVIKSMKAQIQSSVNGAKEAYSQERLSYSQLTEQFERRLHQEIEQFQKKITKQRFEDQDHHIKRLRSVEGDLAPGGNPQERVYSVITLLHKNDPDIIVNIYHKIRQNLINYRSGDHLKIFL